LSLPLFGQDMVANPSDVIPADVQVIVLGFIAELAKSHPWIATLISVMGLCRIFAKPIFSFIHAIIDLTPSTKDDGVLASLSKFFAEHWLGKVITYLIDWTTSIKIVSPSRAAK